MTVTVCTVALFFFFNDTATTEIYTLSLHDALPIYGHAGGQREHAGHDRRLEAEAGDDPRSHHHHQHHDRGGHRQQDRKSTRLNSSHANISYAVFRLKKNKSARPAHFPRTSLSPTFL